MNIQISDASQIVVGETIRIEVGDFYYYFFNKEKNVKVSNIPDRERARYKFIIN